MQRRCSEDGQGRPARGAAGAFDDAALPRRPEFDAATLAFYDREAAAYAARWDGRNHPQLDAFLDRLSPGARLLELGCGGGQDAAAMIARGFDVEPTDGSPGLAAEAQRRLGRAVRVLRFDELAAEAAYDAVWASACLLHVPRAGLPAILTRIRRALRPGGLHFANYKATGAEGRDGLGRWFNQPTAAGLQAVYAAAGAWAFVDVEEGEGGGYDGVQVPWVAVTARRGEA